MHCSDMRRSCEICRRAGGALGVEFDRRHRSCGADQLRENCRVVPDAGTDMHDVLLRLPRGSGNQRRMKRELALYEVQFGADRRKVLPPLIGRPKRQTVLRIVGEGQARRADRD